MSSNELNKQVLRNLLPVAKEFEMQPPSQSVQMSCSMVCFYMVVLPLEICLRKLIRINFWKKPMKANDAIHKVFEGDKILSIRDLHRYEVMKLTNKILRREAVSDTVNGSRTENEVEALRQKRLSARMLPIPQSSLDSFLELKTKCRSFLNQV